MGPPVIGEGARAYGMTKKVRRAGGQTADPLRFARVLFNPFSKLRPSEGHSSANLDSSDFGAAPTGLDPDQLRE
jgi:hypothetical protein